MIGNKIKRLREGKNISQQELAKIVGVKTGDVAEWESGETEPNLLYLNKLTSALDVSYDFLLNEDTSINKKQNELSEISLNNELTGITEDSNVNSIETGEKSKHYRMKKLIIIASIIILSLVISFLLYFFIFRSTSFSKNTKKINEAENSVVKICCYDIYGNEISTGSGFIYHDDNTIITNYHVMQEAFSSKISTNQDITYDVENLVAYSKEKDVAILELKESTGLSPLTLGDSDLINKGETVTAIGSPLGIKNVVSNGILSGRLAEENMEVLQFTASISSGSSGGALFNEKGEVVGITFASYVEGQNLNLAVPINEANNVYNTNKCTSPANSICLKEHPYFINKYLFDQSEIVDLAQLALNPENYDMNYNDIAFDATVSSVLDNQYIYVYTDNSVSNDFAYDDSNFELQDYENNHLIRIDLEMMNKENIDNDIVPGDKIKIIGRIIYNKRGEIDEFDDVKLTYDQIKNGEGTKHLSNLNRVGCKPVIIYKIN